MSKKGKTNWGPSKTVTDATHPGKIADSVTRMIRGEQITGTGRAPLPPGDYSAIPTLAESMTISRRATESFQALPSDIRDRFSNDPNGLNNFLLSEAKHDIEESYVLGLRKRPVPTPAKTPNPVSADNKEGTKNPQETPPKS